MISNQVEKYRLLVLNTVKTLKMKDVIISGILRLNNVSDSDLTQVILGIIQKESSGFSDLVGDNGNSYGLMQLNYGVGTPQEMGFEGTREELFLPDNNIYYGVKYFFSRIKKTLNINTAILYYNSGSKLDKNNDNIPDNQSYLISVLNNAGFSLSYFEEKKKISC